MEKSTSPSSTLQDAVALWLIKPAIQGAKSGMVLSTELTTSVLRKLVNAADMSRDRTPCSGLDAIAAAATLRTISAPWRRPSPCCCGPAAVVACKLSIVESARVPIRRRACPNPKGLILPFGLRSEIKRTAESLAPILGGS